VLPPVLLLQKVQQNRVTKSNRVGYAQSYQITIYSSINQYIIQYKMQKNAKKEQKPHFFTIHCQIQRSWTQSHNKSRTKKIPPQKISAAVIISSFVYKTYRAR